MRINLRFVPVLCAALRAVRQAGKEAEGPAFRAKKKEKVRQKERRKNILTYVAYVVLLARWLRHLAGYVE